MNISSYQFEIKSQCFVFGMMIYGKIKHVIKEPETPPRMERTLTIIMVKVRSIRGGVSGSFIIYIPQPHR